MERIHTYAEYLSTDLSLTLEKMNELYEDLLEQAVKYSEFRDKWFLWSKEEKIEQDAYRTSCHNALIDKFNILARYLKNHDYSVEWRESLGDVEKSPYVRKRIGDFACYLVFVEAVNAR